MVAPNEEEQIRMDDLRRQQRFQSEREREQGQQTDVSKMAKNKFVRFAMAALLILVTLRILYSVSVHDTAPMSAAQIVPGATWTAINTGKHIQAHGASVYEVDGVYYWIGEDKSNGTFFQNINCYASRDLIDWSFVRPLLTRQSDGDLGPKRVVERPSVVFNFETKKWVMYLHIDDPLYQEAKVGVADATSICGSYTYRSSFRPLDHESRDLGLYQEPDGAAYLLTEDRPNGLHLELLAPDYMSAQSVVHTWPEQIESPALIKRDGVYFVLGSQLTGWSTNDNVYATATSLAGPWSEWRTFAEPGSETYHSQTTFVLQLRDFAVYMGDRWDAENLMRSSYVWLPLDLHGRTATMQERRNWVLDLRGGGRWRAGSPGEVYEAENAELFGGAEIVRCRNCTTGRAVSGIRSKGSGLTVKHSAPRAFTRATVMVHYAPFAGGERLASVRVGDGPAQPVSFLPSCGEVCDAYDYSISVAHVSLKAGVNEIKIMGAGVQGPDIDKVEVLAA